jgi:hypothetical protein
MAVTTSRRIWYLPPACGEREEVGPKTAMTGNFKVIIEGDDNDREFGVRKRRYYRKRKPSRKGGGGEEEEASGLIIYFTERGE